MIAQFPPPAKVSAQLEAVKGIESATCDAAKGHPGYYVCFLRVTNGCRGVIFRYRDGKLAYDKQSIRAVPDKACKPASSSLPAA